ALHSPQTLEPGANFLRGFVPTVTAASGAFGLLVAFGVAQVGSLFSADAWNNIGFTAAEVKNPKRDVALSMALGTIIVITLYCLANLAYLFTLPLVQIQAVPDDRVASAALNAIFGPVGAAIMAVAIVHSTFGCNRGLILAVARVSCALTRSGPIARSVTRLYLCFTSWQRRPSCLFCCSTERRRPGPAWSSCCWAFRFICYGRAGDLSADLANNEFSSRAQRTAPTTML